MPTRTEAIGRFLNHATVPDLASLYNADMECQVNVAQDGGERIEGDFKGRRWHGWSDGLTTWKSFRIPYKASSDPEYTDVEIRFDLAEHAEGIGMTGWDWKNRVSRWVAFDFDALIGHSDRHKSKLTYEELKAVERAASEIEWVTIRKSTSGQGLHIYVFVDEVPTENHTEHAALARSILGLMSAITGFDFNSSVDNCGGNMWVWHRKMKGTDGLSIIKRGCVLRDIPVNWRDHAEVIKGKRRRNLPQDINESTDESTFESLTGQRPKVPLDAGHKALIEFLRESDALWWWDQDHHMLVTHTASLARAHEALSLRGVFRTNSEASNLEEQNCFAFPIRRGGWVVRRYTPGVGESDTWDQDGNGWTRCYFNREPDLKIACRSYGGLEDPSGGFVFREADMAAKAAALLGVTLDIKPAQASRKALLKEHKDGRLIIEIDHDAHDRGDEMSGWLHKKGKWTRVFNVQTRPQDEPETHDYDDVIRHLITESNEDYGWLIRSDDQWRAEPLTHVRVVLGSMGLSTKEITAILGSSVLRCWKVVNKPFQPEYPGDREWNRNAAQFRFSPSEPDAARRFSTWLGILQHVGESLDSTVKEHPWCKTNGILTGADYLKCWVASLFQHPGEPLPYLFLYGPQNSGKSILHEALSLLITKGYQRADIALSDKTDFNGELEGAILCVVEETDLRRNKTAYNRIKDWVTSRDLLIRHLYRTPYHIPNTSHWIQCANEHTACPIFAGDSRITMCFVDVLPIDRIIPKRRLIMQLEKEAPDFLAEILNLEIPESNDRLFLPVIETADKHILQQLNQTQLEQFIEAKIQPTKGQWIKFSEFYEKLIQWVDSSELQYWTKIRVGRELPPSFPKGRRRQDAQFYIGNMSWKDDPKPELPHKLVLRGEFLEPEA